MYCKFYFCSMRCMNKITLLLLLAITVASCTTIDVFEKSNHFSNQQWAAVDTPIINFTVTDTSSLYNVYLVLRHTDAYNYNNIWVNITTKTPQNTVLNQQLNVELAKNNKGWLGTGMDDIFEHRIRITRQAIALPAKGNYSFTLKQLMRQDPLQHVLNAGIRIEKAQ
ncbi:MAG: gliding motility lipoprotein GldH [Sphingobacteriales bacterium]|nr:MAG: gliding motility lipoprotein GldH [Sphingobacteriales bacterium]